MVKFPDAAGASSRQLGAEAFTGRIALPLPEHDVQPDPAGLISPGANHEHLFKSVSSRTVTRSAKT